MSLKDVGNWVGYTVRLLESEKFDVTALANCNGSPGTGDSHTRGNRDEYNHQTIRHTVLCLWMRRHRQKAPTE